MIEGVVFDFDGTLTELSLDFYHLQEEIRKVLARYLPAEKLYGTKSSYTIEMIYELSEGCEPATAERIVHDAFNRLVQLECEAAQGRDLFPFTREILGWLKRRGIKIAIVTRNCMDALQLIFEDLWEYVDAVVTRDDTRLIKPHPGQIEQALAGLGVPPENALMVGDHPTDIMAGKAYCVRTVGVLTGATRREAFEQAGADYIACDIRSLKEIVGSWGLEGKRVPFIA